ncbi:MAG: acyltransferase [Lachnospiraceae bacterium]
MEKANEKKGRILYFDLLNIVACFCVVTLHCNGTVFDYRLDKVWIVSMIVQVLAHWCVPVFLMLTGATLMGYPDKYSTKVFFQKRVFKVFIPFLLWSTIYLLWRLKTKQIIYEGGRNVLSLYLNNGIESVFWFFYPLFAIYISMPVLAIFRKKEYKKYVYYMIILAVFAFGFMPLLSSGFQIYYTSYLNPPIVGGYVVFVLTGWMLSQEEIRPKFRYIIYLLGILCTALMFCLTIFLSVRDGKINDMFFEYSIFVNYFMAVAVFVWFKYHNWKLFEKEKWRQAIRHISGASFGIYLIHNLFVSRVFLNHPERNTILWMEFSSVAIYLFSLGIVLLVKRLPILKRLFP